MNQPQVSIIIPVYQAHDYIERCACSLFEQDFSDIEYLFVDDFSDDDSVDILCRVLSSFPEREKSVHIHHMDVNSGVSAVRQYGISLAKGKYIIHCDSDDWIERDMISTMYNIAEKDNSDIVVCDFYEEIKGDSKYCKGKGSQTSDMASDALLLYASLWNKLIRASRVKDARISYPVADCGEDLVLLFQYSLISDKVSYVEKPFYHYCRNTNSVLGVRSDEAILGRHKALSANYGVIEETIKSFSDANNYNEEMIHLGLYTKNLLLPLLARNNRYRGQWISSCCAINKHLMFSRMATVREKLNAMFVFLGLYPIYGRFFK